MVYDDLVVCGGLVVCGDPVACGDLVVCESLVVCDDPRGVLMANQDRVMNHRKGNDDDVNADILLTYAYSFHFFVL